MQIVFTFPMRNSHLRRGLISAQPNSDRCELDEGQIVGREFVISGHNTPTLLDVVEELFDQVTRTVQIRAKADRSLRFRFGGMFAHPPCWRPMIASASQISGNN